MAGRRRRRWRGLSRPPSPRRSTKIEPDRKFYPCAACHRDDFMTRNPNYSYIVLHDLPKIEDLKRIFPDVYRKDPVLVAQAGRTN